jgi:hypothetical protein
LFAAYVVLAWRTSTLPKYLNLRLQCINKVIPCLLVTFFVTNSICAIILNMMSLAYPAMEDSTSGTFYFAWITVYLNDILSVYGLELCYIIRLQAFTVDDDKRRRIMTLVVIPICICL